MDELADLVNMDPLDFRLKNLKNDRLRAVFEAAAKKLGKLEGLTGGGSYEGRMTSPVEVENTWEGTYQIAAKTQAA